jgi:DNA-binding transcriptional MerR regulator
MQIPDHVCISNNKKKFGEFMRTKYRVIGSIRSPLFKAGVLSPVLDAGEDVDFCFELGAFDCYRLSKKQFYDSAIVNLMVRFDQSFDFPGSDQEAESSDSRDNFMQDDTHNQRSFGLFYLSDELEGELCREYADKFNEIWKDLPKEQQRQNGYRYYLLADNERMRICKYISSLYRGLILKKITRELISEYTYQNELNTFLLQSTNRELRDSIKDDCAALLGIVSSPNDIEIALSLFLLLDGQVDWTEEDWEGLYFWAEDYGKRAGLDSNFNAKKWREKRHDFLKRVAMLKLSDLKDIYTQAGKWIEKIEVPSSKIKVQLLLHNKQGILGLRNSVLVENSNEGVVKRRGFSTPVREYRKLSDMQYNAISKK